MEEQAKITAMIKLTLTVYGDLPYAIKNGYETEAYGIAQGIVESAKDDCGLVGKDMEIEHIEYELI